MQIADPRATERAAAWLKARRDGIVDALFRRDGMLAGRCAADPADRALLHAELARGSL